MMPHSLLCPDQWHCCRTAKSSQSLILVTWSVSQLLLMAKRSSETANYCCSCVCTHTSFSTCLAPSHIPTRGARGCQALVDIGGNSGLGSPNPIAFLLTTLQNFLALSRLPNDGRNRSRKREEKDAPLRSRSDENRKEGGKKLISPGCFDVIIDSSCDFFFGPQIGFEKSFWAKGGRW